MKNTNESIYYNVDEIHRAISQNRQISFQYTEWTVSKERHLKKGGARYQISPWQMIWQDGNYYLIGVDEKSGIVKHYRVDKMLKILTENEARNGAELFRKFDSARFAAGTFGMFGGREEKVNLEFENHLVGVMIDRFGQDIMIMSKDNEHSVTRVQVNVSTQFYGWLAALGNSVRVISPENVRKEYRDFLRKALEKIMKDKSMTVKSRLLELLEQHKGETLSGEDIGRELSCTRAAVWKAVNSLRQEGYPIEAGPNKGYMLARESNLICRRGNHFFWRIHRLR